jgi:hypothetical protein
MANENNNAATFARIAELEAMQAELKALKAQTKNMARLKVSQKGAISVYGLQRMPVTLYAGQWERIIDMVQKGTMQDFIKANESALTRKTAKAAKPEAVKPTSESAAKSKRATRKGKQPARDIFA